MLSPCVLQKSISPQLQDPNETGPQRNRTPTEQDPNETGPQRNRTPTKQDPNGTGPQRNRTPTNRNPDLDLKQFSMPHQFLPVFDTFSVLPYRSNGKKSEMEVSISKLYFTSSGMTTPVALSGMEISRKEAMDGAISVGETWWGTVTRLIFQP
jgi:hypothetical protein